MLRPVSGRRIDRRDAYRMVQRIAKAASIPRRISPHEAASGISPENCL
ncbi:MAG: hypothetical protein ACR2JU_07900 [Nocardioidaceae bacterium]